jgi:hypothetical protein
MQRLDRNSWIMLVGSIAVAVALVTLIPYYGLVGGHQEHGVTAAGPLSASSHRYVILPDGVDMVMTAESDTDTATITAIQTHMQDEAARFRAGDYADEMAEERDEIQKAIAWYIRCQEHWLDSVDHANKIEEINTYTSKIGQVSGIVAVLPPQTIGNDVRVVDYQ